jgi:hypothetical protein
MTLRGMRLIRNDFVLCNIYYILLYYINILFSYILKIIFIKSTIVYTGTNTDAGTTTYTTADEDMNTVAAITVTNTGTN